MGLASFLTDPDIGQYLNRGHEEVLVEEVRKHHVVYLVPALEVVAAVALLGVTALAPPDIAWLPFLAALLLALHAGFRAWRAHMDRFVVTTQKVYRVHGVLNRTYASMPLTKILDVSVSRPLPGILLGYGHLTFESAAQDQGLREITHVPRAVERELRIQDVVFEAGLRGRGRPGQSPSPTER